jgi:hypothetical protein
MSSTAKNKFDQGALAALVLRDFTGSTSPLSADQVFIDQTCLMASIANVVGCWEGYVEGVLREFVAKIRVQAHRRTWTLIAQYESLVDKLASELNTPNWDKARDLLVTVTGMDPYPAWIWTPKFSNQNDTKEFFDGVMKVRHAFAHGFAVPHDVPHLSLPGLLCVTYVSDAYECVRFFVEKTDELLEHELKHRHSCVCGWA